MKVAELQAGQGKIDIEGIIVSMQPPRVFNKMGKEGKVANAVFKDDSGQITLSLWNEQVDQVKPGDTVKITNGWMSEWKGDKQLSTGKFGKLEVLGSNPALAETVSSVAGSFSSSPDAVPKVPPKPKLNEEEVFHPKHYEDEFEVKEEEFDGSDEEVF